MSEYLKHRTRDGMYFFRRPGASYVWIDSTACKINEYRKDGFWQPVYDDGRTMMFTSDDLKAFKKVVQKWWREEKAEIDFDSLEDGTY